MNIKAAVLLGAILAASAARADVLGGGDAGKDCRLAFSGVDATDGASGVVCVDGDPACDTDGTADGVCRFEVSMCVGVALAGCTPVEMGRVEVGGVALEAPPLPATSGCGAPASIAVAAGGPAAATTLLGYRGGELGEVDYLNLCCVSSPDQLAAARCSVGVPAAASGCASLPDRVDQKLARAAELVSEAESDHTRARKLLRKAGKQAKRLRTMGQMIARNDDCGFALALMASHAVDTLKAARGALSASHP